MRQKGILQRKIITVLVDGYSTHNFIDATLVEKINLPTKSFEGLIVVISRNNTMVCDWWNPNLQVNLGDFTMKDNFYVVSATDTNMVFGVKCL